MEMVVRKDLSNEYFFNFSEELETVPGKKKWWSFYETRFAVLAENDWQILVRKAVPRFLRKDKMRAWQTAIDILNEAVAYNFFVSIGCGEVQFISETNKRKTPDLRFMFGDRGSFARSKRSTFQMKQFSARVRHKASQTSCHRTSLMEN